MIGEGFSQNIVEVGGALRIVINATISPETTDNTGITTAVGPPYTFEVRAPTLSSALSSDDIYKL